MNPRGPRCAPRLSAATLLLLAALPMLTVAAQPAKVEIVGPFVDLHTGPGRGYPVFDVAERGEPVQVLRRRTDWFKVRTEREREGWVHLGQLSSSLPLEVEFPVVQVADPFIELRIAPDRDYPVTVQIRRGEWVKVLLQRTDWFLVQSGEREGWIHVDALDPTLKESGIYHSGARGPWR